MKLCWGREGKFAVISITDGKRGDRSRFFAAGAAKGPAAAFCAAAVSLGTFCRQGIGRRMAAQTAHMGHQIAEHHTSITERVLAAHSCGGMIVELYARCFPKNVAGEVLIDARWFI